MTSPMESRTDSLMLCSLGATEAERVGATRIDDLQVGHTMGPPSERPQPATRDTTFHRRTGLTTTDRTRYTNSAEATPKLFHGTRDTTMNPATGDISQEIRSIGFTPVFGMATTSADPVTGEFTLFASNLSAATESQLLTIEPATGVESVVATVGMPLLDLTITPVPLSCLIACFTVNPEPSTQELSYEIWDASCSIGTGMSYRWEFSMPDFGYEWCYGADSTIIDLSTNGAYPYDCTLPYSFNPDLVILPFDMGGLAGFRYIATLIVQDEIGNTDSLTREYVLQGGLTEPLAVSITATPSTIDYNDPGVQPAFLDLTVTGGSLPYTYLWDEAPGLSPFLLTTEDVTVAPFEDQTYCVTVTDGAGQQAAACVDITVIPLTFP